MVCRDIRETISAFVDGEAAPVEAAAVREHLASCERCRILERQMRSVGAGVRQVRGPVPDRFRETVMARLESEGAFRERKNAFPVAWRWAAVTLAAAAGLGLFLLTSREAARVPVSPGSDTARLEEPAPASAVPVPPAGRAVLPASPRERPAALSAEDREMLALLDILEDPAAFESNVDAEGVDLLAPRDPQDPANLPRGGKGETWPGTPAVS